MGSPYVRRCRVRWLPKRLHALWHCPSALTAPPRTRRAFLRYVLPPCMTTEADLSRARRLIVEQGLADG